jgi:hypothetical protein
VADVVEALVKGLRDFQAAPFYGLIFGALYAAGGVMIVLSVTALGMSVNRRGVRTPIDLSNSLLDLDSEGSNFDA